MTSYGHPIRFGLEIAGALDAPGGMVELGVRADQLGYDFVGFPDRALDGGFDAWSLASWTAARTTRIQVAATRVQAALRPASVVARAAASLQLFSSGRAAVTLGSGSSSAEFAALTGSPLPEREGVAAVEEAIAVFRALMNGASGKVSQSGTRHWLAGAQPGPVLEREVPLWVDGADPELVALAGRVADGWLVDLDMVGLVGLSQLNKVLDDSATQADRDPREVRRSVSLTGGDAADVDALVTLVVEHGVGTFVLRVEDTHASVELLRTFIEDVAPAVRSRAARALPPGTLSSRPVRRADVLARRRPDVAYDRLPESLADTAIEPGDIAFAGVRSTYLRGGDPGLVLRPGTIEEAVDAVGFAREHRHLQLGLRSGGHGISGRSTNDGGLVLDLGRLNEITVLDATTRLVRIGPGARWKDVATVLQPHGWALGSGDYGGVGVGGLATAGGIGFLARKHGLTIDHLRAVEMVLADGTLVRASDEENTELFWAVRGAGANFGVAVAFEFIVDEVDEVGWAQLAFRADAPAKFLVDFGQVASSAPRDTTAFLIMNPRTGGPISAQVMAMVDSNDPDTIVSQLQPFAETAAMIQQEVVVTRYASVMNMFPDQTHEGRGEPVSRSGLLREITPDFAEAAEALLRSGAVHWFQIRSMGGAVGDVAPEEMAYSHRSARFQVTAMGANAQRMDQVWDRVRPHLDGIYLSFESDLSPDRLTEAYPPAVLARLRTLKTDLDPHNLFRDNFNVTPDPTTAHDHVRSAS